MKRAARMRRELFLVGVSGALVIIGIVAIWAASLKIPDIESLYERKIEQSTKIYDRTGTILLDDLAEGVTRTVVPIEEVSPYIQKAVVAIEDDEFYTHRGVKPTAIIRAMLSNIASGSFLGGQGGSTITQQVVKNSILTKDKTVTRKVKEWVLSIKLEQVLPKEKILELYLNESPYGGSLYGIEEASQAFFGKHAKEVDLTEAAYLAALPQAPTYYSPYGNHRADLDARKNLVLRRMNELGFITNSEYEAARAEIIEFAPQPVSGIRSPHFVFYVRELLEKEYGRSALEQSGWRIITTLDADLQAKGEVIASKYALENKVNFNAENASIVAIDPHTGDILTMVGSRNYFDPDIDGAYNIALANRQPGSSFKPFVYAAAFDMGYTPDTVLFDVRTQFSTSCPIDSIETEAPCYSPQNFDLVFRGPVTMRNALAQSINIPAIQTLYLVGIQNALRVAKSLGITTLTNPDQYGLTLVLGGGEVSLLDMVSAYSVFANEGVKNRHRAVARIEDKDGNVVKMYPLSPESVIDKNIALMISDILSDNDARAPEFGVSSALNFPGLHVAAKTGTTNDYRDAWILGYTPNIAIGSWAGNNDNSAMEKKIAGFIVAPMWHEFVAYALTKYPDEPFPEARRTTTESDKPILRGIWEGGDIITVDAATLQPVPPHYAQPTKDKIVVSVHSMLYWVDKRDPRGPRPETPSDDPQFGRWEYSVRKWAEQNGYVDGSVLYR